MTGRYMVLVVEPGKDLRALPGSYAEFDDTDGVISFREHPEATQFYVVQVVSTIGPVS